LKIKIKKSYGYYHFLIKEYRNNEIGTKILREFESYFSYHFSIDNIYVLITERNAGGQKFWVKNEYEIKRIISNIMENEDTNMLVYGKEK
jgi:ribosomal protein S18 acetylase RimI-like enzyme